MIKAKTVKKVRYDLIRGDFFKRWHEVSIGKVDLILTDPPYGILKNIQAWDTVPDLAKLEIIFNQLLKPSGQAIVFCNLKLLLNLMQVFNNKMKYRFFHIWKKSGGMPVSLNRPINETEFILVFKQARAKKSELIFNPKAMGEKGKPYIKRNYSRNIPTRRMKKSKQNQNLTGIRYPKTIIEAPSKPNMIESERTSHPTQKPEILLRKLILGYSNRSDLILDPFAGSGSTLVSAFKESRNSIGFEIDKSYHTEAIARIDDVTSQGKLW